MRQTDHLAHVLLGKYIAAQTLLNEIRENLNTFDLPLNPNTKEFTINASIALDSAVTSLNFDIDRMLGD